MAASQLHVGKRDRRPEPGGTRAEFFVSRSAVAGLVGAVIQVVGGVVETLDRVRPGEPDFAIRTTVMTGAYLLLMTAMIGLSRSGLCGTGSLGRLGPLAAAGGFIAQAVAQIVLLFAVDLAEQVLFPIGLFLIGLGLILAGIGALRARRWHALDRAIPLICGLYPFLVVFPSFAAAGEPVFLVLSGWGVCLALLTLALYRAPSGLTARSATTSTDPA
jgi:hypothetical protein